MISNIYDKAIDSFYQKYQAITQQEVSITPPPLNYFNKQSISCIDLTFHNLGNQGIADFLSTLTGLIDIKSINLTGNLISDTGVQIISQYLKTACYSLQEIILDENDISILGFKALANALKENYTINIISLAHNIINCDGVCEIAEALKINKSIKSVNLSHNVIAHNGAKALGEALKLNRFIVSLNLEDNKIGDDGIKALIYGLKENTTLKLLYLGCNKITDTGIAEIGELLQKSVISKLNLSLNEITNKGFGTIKNTLPDHLVYINLFKNNINYPFAEETIDDILVLNLTGDIGF